MRDDDRYPANDRGQGRNARRPAPPASAGVPTMRVPPHNLEAETAVLGSILLDPLAFDVVRGIITAADFYKPAHAKIFEAMCGLADRREPIDIVVLTDAMRRSCDLENVGGATYVSWLADTVPSAASVELYAKIVRDKAKLRSLIRVCSEVAVRGYEDRADLEVFFADAEKSVFDVTRERRDDRQHDVKSAAVEAFREIERWSQCPEGIAGVPSGLRRVDELILGFRPSDYVIVAARPSMGKSALASGIALNAAVNLGIPTMLFSVEMSRMQVLVRMISALSRVELWKIKRSFLRDEDWQTLIRYTDEISKSPMTVDDTAGLTIRDLASKARRYAREIGDPGLIVVDYLQLMRGSTGRRDDSREREVSDISLGLKALAKDMSCPVIALSQLNRKVEERTERRPVLSDLRESGSLEQDADVVCFLYRAAYYRNLNRGSGGTVPDNSAEVIVAKQRNGPTGVVEVGWDPNTCTFADLDLAYVPPDGLPPPPPLPESGSHWMGGGGGSLGLDDDTPF